MKHVVIFDKNQKVLHSYNFGNGCVIPRVGEVVSIASDIGPLLYDVNLVIYDFVGNVVRISVSRLDDAPIQTL